MKKMMSILLTLILCVSIIALDTNVWVRADPPETRYTVIAYGDEVNTTYFPAGFGMANQQIVDDPAEQNPHRVSKFEKRRPDTDAQNGRYFEKAFYNRSGGQIDLSQHAGKYLAIDVMAADDASLRILTAQENRGTTRIGFYFDRYNTSGADIEFENFKTNGPYPNAKLERWYTLYAQIPADKAGSYDYINVCFAPNGGSYDINARYNIYYRYLRIADSIEDLKLGFSLRPGLPADPIHIAFQQNYASVGKPLSIVPEGVEDTFTYKWFVDDVVVSGATNTYVPTIADLEKFIEVRATSTTNGQVYFSTLYFSTLPVVYISTETGRDVTSKDTYINAHMHIQGNAEYTEPLYSGMTEIKGRGNNTWGLPKKPYKLKLDKKADLFGMGANKHWVMLADYNDKSLMRNRIAQEFADKNSEDFTANLTSVVCVLNGNYQGLYQFGEHIRVGDSRADIYDWEDMAETIAKTIGKAVGLSSADIADFDIALNENLSWITNKRFTFKGVVYNFSQYGITLPDITDPDEFGGVLMEIDMYTNNDVTEFYSSLNNLIQASKPEYLGTNTVFLNAVKDYFNAFEACMKSGDFTTMYNGGTVSYTDLFDMNSLVEYFFVNEVMGNPDNMRNSVFWYKDVGQKAKFSAPWDFDWSLGKYWGGDIIPYDAWITRIHGGQNGAVVYYRDMLRDPYFLVRAYEHYQKIRPTVIHDMIKSDGFLNQLSHTLELPATVNHMRWHGYSINNANALYKDESNFVKEYFNNRIRWFDNQFATLQSFVNSTGYYAKSSTLDIYAIDQDRTDGNVAITASVKESAMVKAVFYVNGRKYEPIAVSNSSATILIPISALEADILNVVQVRGLNIDGTFNTNGSGVRSAYDVFELIEQPVPLVSIHIKPSTTIQKTVTETLTVTYNPGNTTEDKTVTWSSSNPAVATVSSSGIVTAITAGTAIITADVNGLTATCHVTVKSLLGDVNDDMEIDSTDARMVLQAEVRLIELEDTQQAAANVNGDDSIDSTDARLILQYEVNLIGKF